jgi:hypothetical protein
MNQVNLQQSGGFPLETDTLNFMQLAYSALQKMAALGGDNYILSGCEAVGASITDGYIVIAGEVLEFRGGVATSKIIIKEDIVSRPFEDGQVKQIFFTRYAAFGTGIGAIEWSTVIRLKKLSAFKDLPTFFSSAIDLDDENTLATAKAVKLLNDKIESKLPVGCIVIWGGYINAIPNGYALCDGQEGRPNLTDKFIIGAGNAYPVGSIGGATEVTLTIEQMPEHDHDQPSTPNANGSASGNATSHPDGPLVTKKTGKTGGGEAHPNMPPYYALAYIIKL